MFGFFSYCNFKKLQPLLGKKLQKACGKKPQTKSNYHVELMTTFGQHSKWGSFLNACISSWTCIRNQKAKVISLKHTIDEQRCFVFKLGLQINSSIHQHVSPCFRNAPTTHPAPFLVHQLFECLLNSLQLGLTHRQIDMEKLMDVDGCWLKSCTTAGCKQTRFRPSNFLSFRKSDPGGFGGGLGTCHVESIVDIKRCFSDQQRKYGWL